MVLLEETLCHESMSASIMWKKSCVCLLCPTGAQASCFVSGWRQMMRISPPSSFYSFPWVRKGNFPFHLHLLASAVPSPCDLVGSSSRDVSGGSGAVMGTPCPWDVVLLGLYCLGRLKNRIWLSGMSSGYRAGHHYGGISNSWSLRWECSSTKKEMCKSWAARSWREGECLRRVLLCSPSWCSSLGICC